jgi:hypothetical protein
MLKTLVRGVCLLLCATALAVGPTTAPAYSGSVPKKVTKAADKLKCKQGEPYQAAEPSTFAFECYVKGKTLGAEGNGRTDMLLFKSGAAGQQFWAEWLSECGGRCYVVRKKNLFVAGGNYEKDIAKYAAKKLGGTLLTY